MTSRVIDVSGGETGASDFAWSEDGQHVAVLSRMFRKVRVFDVTTGKLIAHLEDLAGGASSVAFDAHGHVVCGPVGNLSAAATIWDYRNDVRQTIPGPDGSTTDSSGNKLLEFSLDRKSNRLIGVYQLPQGSSEHAAIALYDISTRQLLNAKGPTGMWVSISPGGDRAAFSGRGRALHITKLEDAATPLIINAHLGGVDVTAWSPDGRIVATGGKARAMIRDPQTKIVNTLPDPQTLKLWDAKTGAPLGGKELPELVETISFSPDGRMIAASDGFGTVHLVETANPARTLTTIPAGKTQSVAARFSPDGHSLGRLLTAKSHLLIDDVRTIER